MALTYIAQRYPVEVVVLRRKQTNANGRLKSSYLVLFSGATVSRAGAAGGELARNLADELGRIRENAVKLASDYKYPNRPSIEGVNDFTSELHYLRGTVSGLLNREFRQSRCAQVLDALQRAQASGERPGLAMVIDHPFGGVTPRIVWPTFHDAQRSGLPLQSAFQAKRLEALPLRQAMDLADCSEFFVRSAL